MREPDGDGWPAYISVIEVIQESIERRVKERHPAPKTWVIEIMTLWLIFILCVVKTIEFTIVALYEGYWLLTVPLLVAHLPYVAFANTGKFQSRQQEKVQTWTMPPEMPPPSSMRSDVTGRLQAGGISRSLTRRDDWATFKGFTYKGEAGQYFRVRFYPAPKSKRPLSLRQIVKRLLLLTPSALVFYILWYGHLQFAWRTDVLAALYVALAHLLLLLCILYFLLNDKKSTYFTEMPFDLLISSDTVSATDLLTFLETRLPALPPG